MSELVVQRRVVEVPALPSLGRAYVGAAGDAVTGLVRGGVGKAALRRAVLPQVALRVRGVRVDRERLAAYQRLLGEAVGDTVPAGYLHVLAFPLATALLSRPDSTLPLMGMVHIANAVDYLVPVTADDVLDISSWVENPRPHKRGVLVDSIADIAVDGQVLWRGVSTYLAKGVRLEGEPAPPPEHEEPPAWPTCVWHLDADAGRRYAAVSGDVNPIHMSALTAKALGFRRAIIHGMYTAARALACVGPAARGDSYRWDVQFGAPVYLPGWVNLTLTPLPDGQAGLPGTRYVGWSGGKVHFTGSVTPLVAD